MMNAKLYLITTNFIQDCYKLYKLLNNRRGIRSRKLFRKLVEIDVTNS